MPITKRPNTQPSVPAAEVEKFIQSAPDGAGAKSSEEEAGSVQITLRISKEQLDRITATAKRQGIPRASYIKRAIALQLEEDEK